mgnify:CR=1 FL=1
MDITVIASHPIVVGITLNADVFMDDEDDALYLSNPLERTVPVSFFNPNGAKITFHGESVESLALPPQSRAKLAVSGGDITVLRQEGGEIEPIPLVPPVELNPTNWWNFRTDLSLSQKGFNIKKMRGLYASELAELQKF